LTNKRSKVYKKSRRHSSRPAYCHVSWDTLYVSLAKVRGLHVNQAILRAYLGGDWADKGVLLNRGRKLAVLIEAWMTSVHAGINEDE